MKKYLYILVPYVSRQVNSSVEKWLFSLPELSLIAEPRVVFIQQNKTAHISDHWSDVVQQISANAGQACGFMVWTYREQLLHLSGILKLGLDQIKLPIVVFDGGNPQKVLKSIKKTEYLKRHIINSAYVGISETSGVMVLSENQLYDPSDCYWVREGDQYKLQSLRGSCATIDFTLHLNGQFEKRSSSSQKIRPIQSLKDDILICYWHPGTSINIDADQTILIFTDSVYTGDKLFERIRNQINSQRGSSVVWHSVNTWPRIDWRKNEIAISHRNLWWVVLAAQFIFGQYEQNLALKNLKKIF